MKRQRFSCILLTSDNVYLSNSAEAYARTLFDVKYVSMQSRNQKSLSAEFFDVLAKEKTDYLFNFLSPVILKKGTLYQIEIASVNFHPAPPEWPGIGSASYALYENDETFGVTSHIITEDIDAGRIIRVKRFPIFPDDTCDRIFDRSLNYSLYLYYEILAEISSTGKIPMSDDTWKRKAISRKQFEKWMTLDSSASPEEVMRKIRACHHNLFPGPRIEIAGHTFELPPRKES
ncbi:formyltransferase family protein [Candidatus Latescibacterota bacterium]